MKAAQLRERAHELGFTPADQTRWLAPVELARTALQVGLASAFSEVQDKRELQRGFPDGLVDLPASPDGGCWLDFVADLGDGFDSTFTVASLLARPSLGVARPGGQGEPLQLPRGALLVLGGDEVYPTASSDRYEDKLKGPYRAALDQADLAAGEPRPTLLALPGNHDWYDGLTAFLRVFGQRRNIGAWQTVQGRSYFVARLPHGWWLAGLDSQLGSEIDDPQLDFFHSALTDRLRPGDGVILCAASPYWARTQQNPLAFDSLEYFERSVVTHRTGDDGRQQETGASIRLWLTGDYHHYSRYAERPRPGAADGVGRQMITCGLGGAYLSATHHLPDEVVLPTRESKHEPGPDGRAGFELAARYPDLPTSRRLVRGLFAPPPRGLPYRNPGFWKLVGGGHVALFLVLIGLLGLEQRRLPAAALRAAGPGDVWRLLGEFTTWIAVIVLVRTLWRLVRGRRPPWPPSTLSVGAAIQLLIGNLGLVATVWLIQAITLPDWFPSGRALPDYLMFGIALAGTFGITGLVGCYGFALTLALATSHTVLDWQDSAQAIETCKGFLRIRIEPGGSLLVHPVVVDDICRDWELEPSPGSAQRHRPVPAGTLPPARLVEPPITVVRDPLGLSRTDPDPVDVAADRVDVAADRVDVTADPVDVTAGQVPAGGFAPDAPADGWVT